MPSSLLCLGISGVYSWGTGQYKICFALLAGPSIELEALEKLRSTLLKAIEEHQSVVEDRKKVSFNFPAA